MDAPEVGDNQQQQQYRESHRRQRHIDQQHGYGDAKEHQNLADAAHRRESNRLANDIDIADDARNQATDLVFSEEADGQILHMVKELVAQLADDGLPDDRHIAQLNAKADKAHHLQQDEDDDTRQQHRHIAAAYALVNCPANQRWAGHIGGDTEEHGHNRHQQFAAVRLEIGEEAGGYGAVEAGLVVVLEFEGRFFCRFLLLGGALPLACLCGCHSLLCCPLFKARTCPPGGQSRRGIARSNAAPPAGCG